MKEYKLDKLKIIDTMKEKGFSIQYELAEALNITKSQLSVILNYKFNPIKSNVMKLFKELDNV